MHYKRNLMLLQMLTLDFIRKTGSLKILIKQEVYDVIPQGLSLQVRKTGSL